MVQSYPRMQSSLMDQLNEQKFISLLTNTPLDIMQTHMCSYVGPTTKAWLPTHHNIPSFICPQPISL
jgi:hypothetical protein